jgi:hypothetical protein
MIELPAVTLPFHFWPRGENRYAVTFDAAVPILGYVSLDLSSGMWVIERAGKLLPVGFSYPDEAAQCLVELQAVDARKPPDSEVSQASATEQKKA